MQLQREFVGVPASKNGCVLPNLCQIFLTPLPSISPGSLSWGRPKPDPVKATLRHCTLALTRSPFLVPWPDPLPIPVPFPVPYNLPRRLICTLAGFSQISLRVLKDSLILACFLLPGRRVTQCVGVPFFHLLWCCRLKFVYLPITQRKVVVSFTSHFHCVVFFINISSH